MDIMTDNELLAVIGHEIGHVKNQDTKDAMKSAYLKQQHWMLLHRPLVQ
jgi:putative metalloprotease